MTDRLMIQVENLTKRYGRRVAVNGVTFSVNQGEIVGLLGPNGAGKSTIMRILTGFMPATSGTVRVAGQDVLTQSHEVRRHIGYMPENNPLHRDLRVREYLKFRGSLKGLRGARLRQQVHRVIEQCSLTEVQGRIIGQLSKGYQQRVGLADALVNEPQLIILDEPTIGLDPNQIRSVRQLIKDLGQSHTLLLSTHILPEVEMTCNRVLILHEGRIRAADSVDNLQQVMSKRGRVMAEVAAPTAVLKEALEGLPDVLHVEISPAEGAYARCLVSGPAEVDLRPRVYGLVCERGWSLRELTSSRHTLEDIFARVTLAHGWEGEEEERTP